MQVRSYNEVNPSIEGVREDGWHRRTHYFGTTLEVTDGPQAFLVERGDCTTDENGVGVIAKPHFHRVRQYQFVVSGDNPRVGKHSVEPFALHYADPSTPYGPILAGRDGISFFTLRPRSDVGAYYMPGAGEKMTARAGRHLTVRLEKREMPQSGVIVETLVAPHDDGLASLRLLMAPGSEVSAPNDATGGGQYLLVLDGVVHVEGTGLPRLSLVWMDPNDGEVRLVAGDEGVDVAVLRFPVARPDIEIIDPNAVGDRARDGTRNVS